LNINYIHEPTDLQCGQAVLAMLLEKSVDEIVMYLDNDRETTLREMKNTLTSFGLTVIPDKKQVSDKSELPDICFLSLETPRCWHWSLYCHGVFYDPEHGVMDDFPEANRKYYWEIKDER